MRALIVLGVLLVIAGVIAFAIPVMTIGEYSTVTSGGVTTTTSETGTFVPSWAGAAAVAGGLLLVLLGATGRTGHH